VQVLAGRSLVLAARLRGALEADGRVQSAVAHAGRELLLGALDRVDPRLRLLEREPRDGGRHHGRQRAGERADPQARAALRHDLAELARRQLQPRRDHVGVAQQQLAGLGEGEPAGPALEQLGLDLALERRDLLRGAHAADPVLPDAPRTTRRQPDGGGAGLRPRGTS